MPEPKQSLHRKLAQVAYEAERIPKNGTAPQAMGGFKFVQVGDAADVIRKALAEHNISMIPTAIDLVDSTEHQTSGGKSMTTVTVRTTWTLTDGDSGESTVIQSMGSGADMGDKAIPKAQSSAMKYALLMGFLLSTGDDPEQTDTSDRRPRGSVDASPDRPPPDRPPLERSTVNGGLIGKLVTSGTQDFELRQTPDGWVLPFRVKEGNRAGQIVVAHDELAKALDAIRDVVLDARVTVFGTFSDESHMKGDQLISYKVLHLTRIVGPDFEIPGQAEAPTAPLFDASELEDVSA